MLNLAINESAASRRRVPLFLVDAADGLTPETGEAAGQPQISKNGAAFANTTNTLVAVGNGAYYVELTAGEVDTAGFVAVRYKSAATAEGQTFAQVSALPTEVHLTKAALLNQREHTVATGVDVIKDDDGTTTLRTMTPTETDGVVTVTPT